jgi:hypothetical protein
MRDETDRFDCRPMPGQADRGCARTRATRENFRIPLGQYRARQLEDRYHLNLPLRPAAVCAALPRRVPMALQSPRPSRRHARPAGAGARPESGAQAQPTRVSVPMWWMRSSTLRPPLRAGSFSCLQISPRVLPSHAISRGARCHSGCPGMRPASKLARWWQIEQRMASWP